MNPLPRIACHFVAQGFGVNSKLVMHNDFIILGPAKAPARISGAKQFGSPLFFFDAGKKPESLGL